MRSCRIGAELSGLPDGIMTRSSILRRIRLIRVIRMIRSRGSRGSPSSRSGSIGLGSIWRERKSGARETAAEEVAREVLWRVEKHCAEKPRRLSPSNELKVLV